MAKSSDENWRYDELKHQEQEKQKLQAQQEQYHQMQRDLADAISRLAPLDDIRILLAGGARVDRPVTQGLHPIHYAAYQNFIPAVRLLILRGCDINAMDDNGYTAVHLGAERGYLDLLAFLIENGAKVCFTDMKKRGDISMMADEPLSLALKRDHIECARLLLKSGADPNARYFMGSEINLVSILKVSCIKLLLEHGARPDSRDRSGLTPLMKAARHPQGYATLKVLIDHGADVNDIAGERHDYRTVLHHSIFSGNLDLIRLLLTSGARYPKLDFDKPSPLDIAIISGRHDIAKLLIEYDADVDAGRTTTIGQPLHTALTQRIDNKFELVKLLLDSGADPNSRNSSSRNTGPPMHDYLYSTRQCGSGCLVQSSSLNPDGTMSRNISFISSASGPNMQMVRLLLMYGARIILMSSAQHAWGLVETLERIQEELSVELLMLLIDAAEKIDWFMMSKVIYGCLRRTNRRRTNELFDPSVSADMTPERLSALLADRSAHLDARTSDGLAQLMNGGKSPSVALTLKQISRIYIRRYMSDTLALKGYKLIERLNYLPLPSILIRYILYQD